MSLATAAVLGSLGMDLAFGEPPTRLHPVRWFGRVLETLDREWRRPVLTGVFAAILLPSVAAAVSALLLMVTTSRTIAGGIGVAAVVLFTTTSYRELLATVWRVSRRAESDVPAARRELRALAGRDASDFGAGRIRSAAVESLAENLADGLVAPLFGFSLAATVGNLTGLGFGWTLAFACAGAVWIKAVNTMDSMWGYPGRPLGSGAARLDDVAMWVPARLTACFVAGAFLAPGAVGRASRWVGDVPSPNAGWPMGTLAAALGVRLEKAGVYDLNPGAQLPAPVHVERALRRIGLAGLGAYAVAGVVLW